MDENEFDEIFERNRKRHLTYWADPGRHEHDQINTWDGGRGLYFDDPNGHFWKSLPVRTAAVAQQRPDPTPFSRGHWILQITRTALAIKKRAVDAGSPLRSGTGSKQIKGDRFDSESGRIQYQVPIIMSGGGANPGAVQSLKVVIIILLSIRERPCRLESFRL